MILDSGKTKPGTVNTGTQETAREVLEHFRRHAKDSGFTLLGLTYSPIRGPEGNIEYLGYLRKGEGQEADADLAALVEESHEALRQHGEGNE